MKTIHKLCYSCNYCKVLYRGVGYLKQDITDKFDTCAEWQTQLAPKTNISKQSFAEAIDDLNFINDCINKPNR